MTRKAIKKLGKKEEKLLGNKLKFLAKGSKDLFIGRANTKKPLI
jgi:hypothetical protein